MSGPDQATVTYLLSSSRGGRREPCVGVLTVGAEKIEQLAEGFRVSLGILLEHPEVVSVQWTGASPNFYPLPRLGGRENPRRAEDFCNAMQQVMRQEGTRLWQEPLPQQFIGEPPLPLAFCSLRFDVDSLLWRGELEREGRRVQTAEMYLEHLAEGYAVLARAWTGARLARAFERLVAWSPTVAFSLLPQAPEFGSWLPASLLGPLLSSQEQGIRLAAMAASPYFPCTPPPSFIPLPAWPRPELYWEEKSAPVR